MGSVHETTLSMSDIEDGPLVLSGGHPSVGDEEEESADTTTNTDAADLAATNEAAYEEAVASAPPARWLTDLVGAAWRRLIGVLPN